MLIIGVVFREVRSVPDKDRRQFRVLNEPNEAIGGVKNTCKRCQHLMAKRARGAIRCL